MEMNLQEAAALNKVRGTGKHSFVGLAKWLPVTEQGSGRTVKVTQVCLNVMQS